MDKNENINQIGSQINEKIIGNAISAYLLVFISGLFLVNKTNKYINNEFVRSHTKSAMLLHLGFLITYIVFISNSLFSSIPILGFNLNEIIANILFIGLLILLIIGIYKASKGKTYKINIKNNFLYITNQEKILDITGDGKISEKEKLTILISFVPFIGFLNFGKYRDSEIIENGTRLNIFITLILSLLYIFYYFNLANILFLVYIVLIVFIGINLFARDELIQIRLPKVFSTQYLYILLLSVIEYFYNYFKSIKFTTLVNIIKQKTNNKERQDIIFERYLEDKTELKIKKFLIYIPIFNLIFLFFKNTKYYFHIVNGIVITALAIIIAVLSKFGYINQNYSLLFLFPILFGMGHASNTLAYRMPIIFDIYIYYFKMFLFMKGKSKMINTMRKEVKEETLSVK